MAFWDPLIKASLKNSPQLGKNLQIQEAASAGREGRTWGSLRLKEEHGESLRLKHCRAGQSPQPKSHSPEQLQGCEPHEGLSWVADAKSSVIRIFFVHGVPYRSRKANDFMVYNCIPSILPGPRWHMRYHHPYLVNWSSLTTNRRQVLEVQTPREC